MDTATLATLLAGGVGSGVVGSALTNLTKKYVPDRWRTLFALGVTFIVSVISALITFGIGGVYTWAALGLQVTAALGVAQGVYAIIKKVVPGSSDVDIDHLIQEVTELSKAVKDLTTTNTPTAQITTPADTPKE